MTLMGDFSLIAGETVSIIGAGKFDGKYKINKATHSLSSGYVTSIDLNHTNNPVKQTEETNKAKKDKIAKKQK